MYAFMLTRFRRYWAFTWSTCRWVGCRIWNIGYQWMSCMLRYTCCCWYQFSSSSSGTSDAVVVVDHTLYTKQKFFQTLALPDANSNIDAVFYDTKQLNDLLADSENVVEKAWKTRILLEHTTTRGNLIMFYDAYRGGFAYYSDSSFLPYAELNLIAMKYVTRFRCCHFFIDEDVYETNQFPCSPFIEVIKNEQEKEKMKKKKAQLSCSASELASDVFLKPSMNTASVKNKGDNEDNIVVSVPKITNKFIYLGKIHNFYMLQKVKPLRTVNMGFYDMNMNTAFQNVDTFSYQVYKSLIEKKKQVDMDISMETDTLLDAEQHADVIEI